MKTKQTKVPQLQEATPAPVARKKNVNLLEGYACPHCGHTADFIVRGEASCRVDDDDVVEVMSWGTFEWYEDSKVECCGCGHKGPATAFFAAGPVDADKAPTAKKKAKKGKVTTDKEALPALPAPTVDAEAPAAVKPKALRAPEAPVNGLAFGEVLLRLAKLAKGREVVVRDGWAHAHIPLLGGNYPVAARVGVVGHPDKKLPDFSVGADALAVALSGHKARLVAAPPTVTVSGASVVFTDHYGAKTQAATRETSSEPLGEPLSGEPLPNVVDAAVRRLATIASDDETRFNLNGVLIEGAFGTDDTVGAPYSCAVATDGHRLEFVRLGEAAPNEAQYVPLGAYRILTKLLPHAQIGLHQFGIYAVGACPISVRCDTVPKGFPAWRQVFPTATGTVIEVSTEELRDVLKRCEAMAKQDKRPKQGRGVALSVLNAELLVTGTGGASTVTASVKSELLDGKALKKPVGVSAPYLLDALATTASEKAQIRLSGPETIVVVNGNHLVMPIRI